jgi:hypothetical protein
VPWRQSLGAEARDLEDVGAAAVSGHLQLLVEPRQLILPLDGVEDGLGYQGLGIPVGQGIHDGARLFIGIYWAIVGVVVVFEGCVCIQRGLCNEWSALYILGT